MTGLEDKKMVPKSDLRYPLSEFVYLAWLVFFSYINPFFHVHQKIPCTFRGKRGPVNGWSSGIFCPEASLSYFERVRFVGEKGFYSNHEECRDQDAATGKFLVWVFVEVTTIVFFVNCLEQSTVWSFKYDIYIYILIIFFRRTCSLLSYRVFAAIPSSLSTFPRVNWTSSRIPSDVAT